MPFGLAPKTCIANHFSLLLLKTIIFYTFSNFKFEKCDKTQIPIKLESKPIGLKTESGIWLKLVARPR